jgi:SAM-dependent methyltransferase
LEKSQSCHICQHRKIKVVQNQNAKSPLFRDTTISICTKCQISWITEEISQSDLHNYYKEEYGKWRRLSVSPKEHFSNDSNLFKPHRAKTQLQLAQKYLKKRPSKILDIGAGLGTTLYIAKSQFYPEADLFAMEPDKYARENLHYLGAEIYTDYRMIKKRSFDLVIVSHVLEHLNFSEMSNLLQHIHASLMDDGVLLIEVPNDNFIQFPNKIRQNKEPHLTFFSTRSLASWLRQNDFNILFLKTVGSPLKKSFDWFLSKALNLMAIMVKSKSRRIYGKYNKCIRLVAKKEH